MDPQTKIRADQWYNELRMQIVDSIPVGESRAIDVALPPPEESLGMFLRHVLAQIAAKEPASDSLARTAVYQQTKDLATRWIALPKRRSPAMAMRMLRIFDAAGIDLRLPFDVDFYGTPPPPEGFPDESPMLPDDRYIEGNIGIHPQCAGIATADTTMGSDPYMIYTVAAGVKVLPLFFFNEVNRKACNVLIFGPLTAKMPKFRSQGFESKAVYVTLPGAWSVSKALSKAVGFDDLPMDATEMLAYSGPILGRATETYEDVRQRVRDVYDNPPWNFGRNKKRVKIADPDRRAPRFSKKRTLTDYPGMFAARNPTEGLVDGLKELGKLLIADDIVYNVN